MLETNLRIVQPGRSLKIAVRRASVQGPTLSPDLLERACGVLRHRHGLAAVTADSGLLIATDRPLTPLHLESEEWELDVADAGEPVRYLSFMDRDDARFLPQLIERTFLAQIAKRTWLWTLNSPRIWYEPDPFRVEDGIAAYCRYEIAGVQIDDVGIGIAVDVGTAFFTTESLAYFFDPAVLSSDEQERRRKQFEALTGRQQGQKGTLLYDTGRAQMTCYFDRAPLGTTCATTGKIRVKGTSYPSLAAYYRENNPELGACEDTPAVQVSFKGLERAQWVTADRVRVRVMNDDVPKALKNVDKIAPDERRSLIEEFWHHLEPHPLGKVAPGMMAGFWQPEATRVTYFVPPELHFGQQARLEPPPAVSASAYRQHFRQRQDYLERYGCYSTSPTGSRVLYCAYPQSIGEGIARKLAGDVATTISRWTGQQVSAHPVQYTTVADAVEQLRHADRGVVLFVLDDEPAAYYEAAFHLEGWRIKRITEKTLLQHERYLRNGAWDKQRRANTQEQGQNQWNQVILMNALDVLQQMDGVPWRISSAGQYDAQVVIDVGHDRRYFALSLLIARSTETSPNFGLATNVQAKADHKQETINPRILADELVRLVQGMLSGQFDALASLLVLRDGRTTGGELQGITDGVAHLRDLGLLTPDAVVDIVDIHKESLKPIRLWERGKDGLVANPLEGTAVQISSETVVLTTTGSATLHQGTAEPVMLVATSCNTDVLKAAESVFAGTQLNWSSPRVAQRLPLPLKRTDDELRARAAQEVRRLR